MRKIAEFFVVFSEKLNFNFHVSGSTKSVCKQPTQVIIELNSSLRHIIVTHVPVTKTTHNGANIVRGRSQTALTRGRG